MSKKLFKPSLKYKMDDDEIQMHLHLKRKGSNLSKNKKKYSRRNKHNKFDYLNKCFSYRNIFI